MKKLVVVSDTFFPKYDGVTTFIEEIVPRLTKDFKITILAPKYGEHDIHEWKGCKVVTFPVCRLVKVAGYSAPIALPWRIRKHIKDADVVFVQSGPLLGGKSILISRLMRKPVVMYMHQIGWEQLSHIVRGPKWWKSFVKSFMKWFARFLSNRCTMIMAPAKDVKEKLRHNRIKRDIEIVPLGIDLTKFEPIKNKTALRKQLDIPADRLVIGFCGRISYEKGLDTLIEAYKRLSKTHPNLYLLIVGEGDETIKKQLLALDNVKITGFVNNVVEYYNCMDIFVLPSLTETTGLTTLEAMACEVPTVMTPVGVGSSLKNGFNGMVFPKRSVYGLTVKLEKLIKNPNLRRTVAKNGMATVKKEYTWNNTYKRIRTLLDRY